MTSSSLLHRQPFKLPSDSDDDDPLENELDEATQSTIISSLQHKDESSTKLYTYTFLAVIHLPAFIYLFYTTFLASSGARSRQSIILGILGLTSVLVSTYTLAFLPLNHKNQHSSLKGRASDFDSRSPIEKFLPKMNLGLSALLLVVAGLSGMKGLRAQEEFYRELLPAIVCAMTGIVRGFLEPVDLEELKGAKFDYKGA